jgi:L-fucose isomerase-like protein
VVCRTTVTVEISDVRQFIRKALGNHHVMVYGDHIGEIRALSQALGMNLIEL